MNMKDSMASYDIQGQKGFSLGEFNASYATEEQCILASTTTRSATTRSIR